MTKYEKIIYMQQCLQVAKEEMDRARKEVPRIYNETAIKTMGEDYYAETLMNKSLVDDNLRNVARVAFQASRR